MSRLAQLNHRQHPTQQRQHIETIVIDDSDSDPDLPQVIGVSHNTTTTAAADKNLHLPGQGQRGQFPLPRAAIRKTNHNQVLSERAKAKSRAFDSPIPSPPSPVLAHAIPYQADPDAIPIALPLLSTYNCPICLSPPTNAVSTPCGHVFCGGCLFDALATQTKKKQQEDAERRMFIPGGLYAAAGGGGHHHHQSLPTHIPAALTEAHLRRSAEMAADGRARTSLRATANANAHAAASTSGSSRNPLPSHPVPSSSSAPGPAAAVAAPAAATASSSALQSTSASTHQPGFINGARAVAQNAFERLRPFATAMFPSSTIEHHQPDSPAAEAAAAEAAAAAPASSQGSTASSSTTTTTTTSYSDRFASPPPSSAASSSSGSGSASTGLRYSSMHLHRPHPGMPFSSSILHRSSPPARAVHNLAGICPLCRGQILKGFNVNNRTRPSANKYVHRDGRPRRSVKNIDPSKGKVLGLRFTLGRPVDDPYSVALERAKKRTREEFEEE
ncbi:hypothetical protein A4X09_0g3489 [Tilletia walkeri]|uniref:RING-type domain-containing protein n=1 Tax=Tilletia walkeri TaxID=117179 RepID=A0A8X7N7Y8_9BASI|nr:hypothetical protein A4X09_0g3489 [Tilletia walkeri]